MLPYQNPQLPIEERLDDLISRMTLEELIMQTDQFGPGDVMEGTRENWTLSLEKAKELLQYTDLSVGEIAATVGFTDALYFSRAFHRYASCSPSEFRRNR